MSEKEILDKTEAYKNKKANAVANQQYDMASQIFDEIHDLNLLLDQKKIKKG
ncbi:MAG: hypothetical protein JNJ99_03205 [Crocinitomicaceae bacterium]|nr:hypothetical protein [Crocinitomicaceae bacterium]